MARFVVFDVLSGWFRLVPPFS